MKKLLTFLMLLNLLFEIGWAETTTVTASKITSNSFSWTGSGRETWSGTVNGGVVNQNTWNKRVEEAKKSGKRLHLCHGWEDDANAKTILQTIGKEYSDQERKANRYEYRTVKIKGIQDDQQFLVLNHDLHYIDDIGHDAFQHLKSMLDKEAYIDMLENTFTQNWMNVM